MIIIIIIIIITRKSLQAMNTPQMAMAIKGRTCNPTPLVHQDMTKKTTFYEQNKER